MVFLRLMQLEEEIGEFLLRLNRGYLSTTIFTAELLTVFKAPVLSEFTLILNESSNLSGYESFASLQTTLSVISICAVTMQNKELH